MADSRMTASEMVGQKSGRPPTDPAQPPLTSLALLQSGRSLAPRQLRFSVVFVPSASGRRMHRSRHRRGTGHEPLRTLTSNLTIGAMTIAFPSVVDLRERPEFASIIADRVWRAWWEPKGYTIAFVENLVQQHLNVEPVPLALVAHDGGTFLGTASVIASELDERPQYTPWQTYGSNRSIARTRSAQPSCEQRPTGPASSTSIPSTFGPCPSSTGSTNGSDGVRSR